MPKVEFLFDFGSPNAYLCHRVIPGIERRQGVRFDYVPVLLGGIFKATNNRSPAEAFAGIRNKPEYHRLEVERFLAAVKTDLPVVLDPEARAMGAYDVASMPTMARFLI
mgnify:CR=1 FL=1